MSDSLFESSMNLANEAVAATFGKAAVYTNVSAVAANITCIAGPINGAFEQSEGQEYRIYHRQITVSDDEVPSPLPGETITVEGDAWTIADAADKEMGFYRLSCRIDVPLSKLADFTKRKMET